MMTKVRYEDLVLDPAKVVSSLRSSFKLSGHQFENILESTKDSSESYSSYYDYYTNEKYAAFFVFAC